jgi:hypothetical protein
MSKKQLYIVIGIFAIITIGFFVASFILTRKNNTPSETNSNPFGNFSPFGNTSETNTNTGSNSLTGGNTANNQNVVENPNYVAKKNLPILRQVTKNAIAGLYPTQKTGKAYVNYVEKENGNVFESKLETMQINRISNAVIPRITEASFANQGSSVVMRYLKNKGDTIFTFILEIPKTTSLNDVPINTSVPNGRFLPVGITDIKISSDEKSFFYMTRSDMFDNRSSLGSIFTFEPISVSEVFQSPFSEWLPVSYNSKNIMLQTKASQKVDGFLYSFDIKTGVLKKILGDIKGLTTLPSPDGQHILYSESTKGGLALRVYHIADNTTTNLILQTLPEKCLWKNDNTTLYCATPKTLIGATYPDVWYQGAISFSDNLWQVDTKTGKASVILVPTGFTTEPLDMTSLSLSPLQDFIYFINKRDSSLWAFEVSKAEM